MLFLKKILLFLKDFIQKCKKCPLTASVPWNAKLELDLKFSLCLSNFTSNAFVVFDLSGKVTHTTSTTTNNNSDPPIAHSPEKRVVRRSVTLAGLFLFKEIFGKSRRLLLIFLSWIQLFQRQSYYFPSTRPSKSTFFGWFKI